MPATAWGVLAIILSCLGVTARADRVEMADGRVLEGRFALVAGVAVDPIAEASGGRSGGTPVLMCDDELTRTFVSRRRVVKAEEGVFGRQERIEVPQRVPENGRRVASVGGIIEATPFDQFGRRILALATATGRADVVQGITVITPRWTKVEGVLTDHPLLLDMRLATSSIPRDQLRRVIDQQIDSNRSEDRLRVVRLFLQAERYEEARAELDLVLADFPGLKNLAEERRSLGELSANRLLDEIRLRGKAGQDALAMRLLDDFPVDDASGETVEAVREARDAYRDRQALARRLLEEVQSKCDAITDEEERAQATMVLDEIGREMTFASLDRLATFDRLGTEADMPADRAVALAITGWLEGAAAAGENLKLALSAVRVRGMVRDYLLTTEAVEREALRGGLAEEEAGDAATIAAIAKQMPPPLAPPEATAPGLYELAVIGSDGQTVPCLVQLPPEYDPLRRYPAIVSLHAAFTTPINQVEWWAGAIGPDGTRLGQATRQGYIVIAPAWTEDGQTSYGYSAREHAAVLNAVREAQRRFSIDTDRVFLSGHSLGGDAAWDIALAHPDLWAGLVAISPAAGRYVNHYWHNARSLPIYLVGGELDNGNFSRNGMDIDRYLAKGFDTTYVEYRGRGHEHFSDEILRIFDWMGRRRRTFFPTTIDAVSMRPWDNFFWWVEMSGAPQKTVVLPSLWPPGQGVRPFALDAKTTPTNAVNVHCGAERVRIWLSPEMIDFTRPVTVTLDGRKLTKDTIRPDAAVMLEDLRTRADRQHPFWAVVESSRTQSAPGNRKAASLKEIDPAR
ncbi:MAG: peptidase [Planctomycetota bacterium]|nr:MAG: peptidase [Planctomycetota bacterium]